MINSFPTDVAMSDLTQTTEHYSRATNSTQDGMDAPDQETTQSLLQVSIAYM